MMDDVDLPKTIYNTLEFEEEKVQLSKHAIQSPSETRQTPMTPVSQLEEDWEASSRNG